MRERILDIPGERLLVSRLASTEQERDLKRAPNCGGVGRIRHFNQRTSEGWPTNPLPIVPACIALGIAPVPSEMTAQVFQNAACNWRCWYCYVPFALLSADPRRAEWLTAAELIDRFERQSDRPRIVDLSGGSPDLTPEWTLWTMQALVERGLHRDVYLWQDDNLSTSYLFTKLSLTQQAMIREYPCYGRVACFKGFDAQSFAFNTGADESAFDAQFELMSRLLVFGIDLYAYVTLTTPSSDRIDQRMSAFVDSLQRLHPLLPLRTVPLEIQTFTPVVSRMTSARESALENQQHAVRAWQEQIERRFPWAVDLKPEELIRQAALA